MTSFISQTHETGHLTYSAKTSRLTYTIQISQNKNATNDYLIINESHWLLLLRWSYRLMNKN